MSSFRSRNNFQIAYYNRKRKRMQVFDVSPEGIPTALVCADRTRRRIGSSGTEGALAAACAQVKVNLVPVIEPRVSRHHAEGTSDHYEDGVAKIRCIMDGLTLHPEPDADGYLVRASLTRKEAIDRYGKRTVDVCERIPGRVA